jgi:hypothetical protein
MSKKIRTARMNALNTRGWRFKCLDDKKNVNITRFMKGCRVFRMKTLESGIK